MPDVSMVQQQTLIRAAYGTSPQESEVATLFSPRSCFGTQTNLSRSQSQFLKSSGSIFSSTSTSPGCSRSQPAVKTPVMHPNLVCTLKSILSPKDEFDGPPESSSFITSPIPQMAQQSFQDRINALTALHSSSTTTSPDNTPWSNLQVSESKAKVLQQEQEQEAVLVPVDLIQNRRPYQCAFTGCQRTFKNPQTMRMHHKTHFSDAAAAAAAGRKLGGADSSQQALTLPPTSSLKAGHNKKIPSRCPMCYKTFVGLYELRRHFGRKHSDGEKRHACRKCAKRFHIEVDLRDHEKLCGEPIFCSCGMKFAFKCNLVAHKRTHPKCRDRAQENGVIVTTSDHIEQSKRRKLSDPRSPPPRGVAEPAPTTSSPSQLTSPVQQPSSAILDSASASSTSSPTSPSSTSFVAEALPDFDVTSTSSCLDYHYHSSLSADAYIKFPLDHYFLASYQALPQRGAQ